MHYEVKLTTQAFEQIENVALYISNVLRVPETAEKWINSLYNEISKLDLMPSRHPLTEEEPWHTAGIHKMPFKNFLVYYLIDDNNKIVWILAILYGRRDQLAMLSKTLLNK